MQTPEQTFHIWAKTENLSWIICAFDLTQFEAIKQASNYRQAGYRQVLIRDACLPSPDMDGTELPLTN